MGTSIEWTDLVWNPTTGCSKISAGCKNCYAEKMHKRLIGIQKIEKYNRPFLDGAFEYEKDLMLPFKWEKPKRVFVDSMSDLFHKNISVDYIAKVYAVMLFNSHLTFQVLTKRPERRLEILRSIEFSDLLMKYFYEYRMKSRFNFMFENRIIDSTKFKYDTLSKRIWEGTSVENKSTKHRIDGLRNTPAAVRFLSVEPLLEDLGDLNLEGIDQVIVGGESGFSKRPFEADWARSIMRQCKEQGVAFYMKQMDKVREIPDDLMVREWPVLVRKNVFSFEANK